MLQLRNRYHIEKRRIENLQAEYSKEPANSRWPLYEQMSFLSDHMPVRRSFRTMNCRRPGEYAVKNEGSGEDSEMEYGRGNVRRRYYTHSRRGPMQVRSYGSLIAAEPEHNGYSNTTARSGTPAYGSPRHTRFQRQENTSCNPQTIDHLPNRAEKFLAFGKFLTASLLELPENDSLPLVEQFTTQLVYAYLRHHEDTIPPEPNEPINPSVETNGHDKGFQEE